MKKILLLVAIALAIPLVALAQRPTPPLPKNMPTPAAPSLSANSYILVDFNSNHVLVESNPDMRVEPASITKVMTSYVVFTELASGNIQLDDAVNISEIAWRTGGSRMFIEPKMEVTVQQPDHATAGCCDYAAVYC
ncbi:D-alanyl-D-alanine carboxypeptidase family protein [Pseudomonadota bacterium]